MLDLKGSEGERASLCTYRRSVRRILTRTDSVDASVVRYVVLHSIYPSFTFQLRSSKKWYPCHKRRCQAKRRYVDRVAIEISPRAKLPLNAMQWYYLINTVRSRGQGSEGGTGLWRTSKHFRRKGACIHSLILLLAIIISDPSEI